MRVLIAAGGTGGHIYPAIAVACALKDEVANGRMHDIKTQEVEVRFVGVGRDAERKIFENSSFAYEVVPFVPLVGKGIRGLVNACVMFPYSLFVAYLLFRRFPSEVVLGCGGYPSFVPFVLAWLMRIPRVLLEQNMQVGRANQLLSKLANHVFAVPGARGFSDKVRVTYLPNPVREEFYGVSKWRAPEGGEALKLLIVGGSQGARTLNDAIVKLMPWLFKNNVSIVHQTGNNDFERIKSAYADYTGSGECEYKVMPFFDKIWEAYGAAHLVIGRAGAMTVAEIIATGRPAVFVPLSGALGHQKPNTLPMVNVGAAVVVDDNNETSQRLESVLEELLTDSNKLISMAQACSSISETEHRPASIIAQALRAVIQH